MIFSVYKPLPRKSSHYLWQGNDLGVLAFQTRTNQDRRFTSLGGRIFTLGALFVMGFALLGFRLVAVTLDSLSRNAVNRSMMEASAPRATILDRHGILLATMLPTWSIYADPSRILDKERVIHDLSQVFYDLDQESILERLQSKRRFVWIRRHITPKQRRAFNQLGTPGFEFRREWQRVYPKEELANHLIGFTDIDSRGLAGIEHSFDARLSHNKTPLVLTLDARLQHVLAKEIDVGMRTHQAKAAAGLILDLPHREVLALVSRPDFDSHEPGSSSESRRFNRATLGVYELGSIFKLITAAGAIDIGAMRLFDGVDTTGPLRIGKHWVYDSHPIQGWQSLADILQNSSNIGIARIATAIGLQRQRAFLERLGLKNRLLTSLPEIAKPIFPHRWRKITGVTASFGYGIAVSPLQFSVVLAALIDDGILRMPRFTGEDEAAFPPRQVVKPSTVRDIRRLMRAVVRDGNAQGADVPGVIVGGKTGTAEKIEKGYYKSGKVITSFIGAFPMHEPRYLIFVFFDEPRIAPRGQRVQGSTIAAPIVGQIIRRIAPILGVPHYDESLPAIRDALQLPLRVVKVRHPAEAIKFAHR